MVISCSAYGCSNKWSRKSSKHFHRFPLKSKTLCDKWVFALKRKDFSPTTASIVCSDHFKSTDYIRKPGVLKRFLKKDAVPSKFNFPSLDKLSVDFALDLTELKKTTSRGKRKKKLTSELITNWPQEHDSDNMFICEMEVNENDNAENRLTPNTTLTDDDATEEDSELMNADEEDKCYILGSIWGERLKLVPLNLRFVVRRLIDQIFEEARTGKLTG